MKVRFHSSRREATGSCPAYCFTLAAQTAYKQKHQQTPNAKIPLHVSLFGPAQIQGSYYPYSHLKFADAKASQSESHTVLDFQAGKDVGLGMFGSHGSSVLSAGVQFRQFGSKSNTAVRALPDLQYPTAPINSFAALQHTEYNKYTFTPTLPWRTVSEAFRGIGPSVAWSSSARLANVSDSGELTLDFGA